MIGGTTRLVGLLGWPVTESLSPRMQNAAFAVRGLDWAYVALPVIPEPHRLSEAVRGLTSAGFVGANVTAPHKGAVVELCDEVDDAVAQAASANTLAFRGGLVHGWTTDAVVLEEVDAPAAAVVVGAGGAAQAFVAALQRRGARVKTFSRGGEWPPETDAELIVHATPVVDELAFEPRPGQVVIDLPYRADGRPTALAAAARTAGSRLIDGREVLVRQGAASFELWTGIQAPMDVMRAAVRPYASLE